MILIIHMLCSRTIHYSNHTNTLVGNRVIGGRAGKADNMIYTLQGAIR